MEWHFAVFWMGGLAVWGSLPKGEGKRIPGVWGGEAEPNIAFVADVQVPALKST